MKFCNGLIVLQSLHHGILRVASQKRNTLNNRSLPILVGGLVAINFIFPNKILGFDYHPLLTNSYFSGWGWNRGPGPPSSDCSSSWAGWPLFKRPYLRGVPGTWMNMITKCFPRDEVGFTTRITRRIDGFMGNIYGYIHSIPYHSIVHPQHMFYPCGIQHW